MINNNDRYKNYTREELINELVTLKKKKYGLVWDKKNSQEILDSFVNWENMPENFIPRTFPVLEEVKNNEIFTDKNKPINLLIEGDNYHSLAVLNFTHNKSIDLIYIDPPYNTGNGDFKFNDQWIDKEDSYRHSKWLSFMEKRLKLAKNLLSSKGVMFIHIDEHEVGQLILLCHELFEENNVDVLIWEKTANITNTKIIRRFKQTHEYLIVCYKDKINTIFGKIKKATKWAKTYSNPDNDPRGPFLPGIISLEEEKSDSKSENFYSLKLPSGRIITREWYYPESEVQELIKDNRIYFPRNGDGIPRIKIFQNEEQYYYCNSILMDLGTITTAREEIKDMFDGKDLFSTPKPIKLGMELIRLIKDKNITILDFFAGSGTVGHSVLKLNSEDEGNRKFILCTDNENKICSEVCYPRISKAIKGYKNMINEKIPGLGGNLKYFRNNFVGSQPTDRNKRNLVNKSSEMICIRENIFNPLVDNGLDFKIFSKDNNYLGIIFNEDAIGKFIEKANNLTGRFSIYCFSYGEFPPEKEFAEIMKNKYTIKAIPEIILKIYREIFKN